MVAENTNENKLVQDYELIRRREYELITTLLDVLPKVENLEPERVSQVRDALFHADHPFLMVFVGPFSSGKSSIINALLGERDLLRVGVTPTTDRITILRYGDESQSMTSGGDVDTVFYPSPLLRKVSFVDTPGLESVFQQHEETTRKFLHRSDVVFMVMLATQAMTQRNLEYLQTLKDYGKKVIILISQADLLTPEETETVKQYVLEQSQSRLGFKPDVWMVSAQKGFEARAGTELDQGQWRDSGLYKFEDYIDRQLGDATRLRTKLQTPLQIIQNVNKNALMVVRGNQTILDRYQSISENIDQQLKTCKLEQEKNVRDINNEITEKFTESATRGSEAIREIFHISRAFGSLRVGLLELTGINRLLQRSPERKTAYIRETFNKQKTFEPIDQLPEVVNKLGPRLEGRDIQDIDDLVKYAQREIKSLPPKIGEKVIGNVQAPLQYDRTALQTIRGDLESIENEARTIEVERLANIRRSTVLYLALWIVLVIILGVALLATSGSLGAEQPLIPLVLFVILLAFGMFGFLMLPIVGRIQSNVFKNRLHKIQNRYLDVISTAADKQIEYGMRLRSDAVAPLTRLIEAQTNIQKEQLEALQKAEGEMIKIEADLNSLGKRGFFGMRG